MHNHLTQVAGLLTALVQTVKLPDQLIAGLVRISLQAMTIQHLETFLSELGGLVATEPSDASGGSRAG